MQQQGKCIGVPGIAAESEQERAWLGRLSCRQAYQNDALAILRRQFDMACPGRQIGSERRKAGRKDQPGLKHIHDGDKNRIQSSDCERQFQEPHRRNVAWRQSRGKR